MDADEIKASSYTEIFENVFPYYLAIGMSYDEFWFCEPSRVIAYRRADEIKKRRMNEQLWLNGIYMSEALASTVGSMFSKQKYYYPSEPKPITMDEIKARQEREQKAKMDQIKARFTARALNINARKGVEQ